MRPESLMISFCAILSVVGSLSMMISLYKIDRIRYFAQKLVFCLSLSDFLFSSAMLSYIDPNPDDLD